MSPCTDPAGTSVQLPHDPLGIFSLFFDDSMVGMIVEETNRYAEQCLQETNKQWSTNAEEVRAYLGFLIFMRLDDKLPARGEDGFSRLQKVDPIISALKERFKRAYYPHSQLSVDEAMIPFKGRSSMKQYLPMKRGFKV